MPIRSVTLRIVGDDRDALNAVHNAVAEATAATKKDYKINITGSTRDVTDALSVLRANLAQLGDQLHDVRVGIDDKAGQAELIMLGIKWEALRKILEKPIVTNISMAKADAQILATSAAAQALDDKFVRLSTDAAAAAAYTELAFANKDRQAAAPAGPTLAGVLGLNLLGTALLFGGAKTTSGIHVLIDGIAELAAIFVPATIAAVVFTGALAGLTPTVATGYQRVVAMSTAMDVWNYQTGSAASNIPGLQSGLTGLNQQLRPQVWSVWGDALDVANGNTGIFAGYTKTAADFVEKLAATITVRLGQSKGVFADLVTAGTRDLSLLWTIISNVGSALGHMFQVSQVTHVAEDLLVVIGVFARFLNLVTSLPTPLLATAVALHAVYLWGGLLSTPFIVAGKSVLGFLQNMRFIKGAEAEMSLAQLAGAANGTGEKFGFAAGMSNMFKGALSALGKVPIWGWVAIGAIALVGLAIWLDRAKDSTQQLIDTVDTGISKASAGTMFDTMIQGVKTLQTQMTKITQSAGWKEFTAGGGVPGKSIGSAAIMMNSPGQSALSDYTAVQKAITGVVGEMATYSKNITWIEQEYHVGYATAVGIAAAANVNLSQSITGNSTAAQIQRQEIMGLMTGYSQLQTPVGIAGKNFEALAYSSNDITTKISQLNSAWDALEKQVTGSQTTFDTFAQGLATLSGSTSTFTLHLGVLSTTGKQSKTALDALTTAGVNFNQAFYDEVGNLQSYVDALRTAGGGTAAFTQGVKGGIAALLPYAKGSKSATDTLYLLAQQANYTGSDSIAGLSKWAGVNAKGALDAMKKSADSATTAASNLAGQIQNLLNVQFEQDVIKITSSDAALQLWTKDILAGQTTAANGRSDRANLIHDLELSGISAKVATGYVDGLTTAIGKIPATANPHLIMTGTGTYTITNNTSGGAPPIVKPHTARGWLVSGGTPGVDSVPILAMAGEAVVPRHLVPAIAPLMSANRVPGFASGGLVGNLAPSQFAAWPGNVQSTFTAGFGAAMATQIAAAMTAAIAAGSAAGGVGLSGFNPAGSGELAFMEVARRLGWGAGLFQDWVNVEMREAGFSLTARNPSSGAYGMAQFINGPGEYAQYGGNAGTYIGQAVAMANYIIQRYGTPAGAWSHEQAFNWYDNGGLLMPGLTMAVNNTGLPELVTPLRNMSSRTPGGGGGNIYICVQGDTDPDGAARRIQQKLRALKKHNGNLPLGLA